MFGLNKHNEFLSFSQLSEGERTLAALAADIARRLAIANPDNEPLQGDGVVLIDEIDLHLHPRWQANALPALRRTFPNLQFIVATHSPIVVSHAPSKSLRVLRDFQLAPTPAATFGRDPNALIEDVFDAQIRPTSVQEQFDQIAALIDDDNLDEAKQQLAALAQTIGESDAELVRLNGLIGFLEPDA